METTNVPTNKLDLTYAIQVSRKDATALYFARPKENYEIDKAPQVISGPKDNYKSPLISAANKLHNDFVNGSETISVISNKVINKRISKDGNNYGILIADPNFGSQVDIIVPGIPDGDYTNIMNNKTVTIKNGVIKTALSQGGAVLERYTSGIVGGPTISVSTTDDQLVFSDAIDVEIEVKDAVEAFYRVNGVITHPKFTGKVNFTLGEGDEKGSYLLEVFAIDEEGIVASKTMTLTKSDLASKAAVLINASVDYVYYAWIWISGGNGHFVRLTKSDTNWMIDKSELKGEDCIIFVRVPLDIDPGTSGQMAWHFSRGQTGDLNLSTQIFDYNEVGWR